MSTSSILFAAFAMTMANATTFATIGLFGRSIGLGEFQVGTIFVSSAVLFLVTSSRWGRLADRWGRRPVIVVGLAGTAVSLLLLAGIAHAGGERAGAVSAFVALLAARLVYGLLAGGTQPASIAHVADVTTASARSAGIARIGAAIGLGSIAGPLSVASLVDIGMAVPLLVGAVLASLAAAVVSIGSGERRHAMPIGPQPASHVPARLGRFLVLAFAMHVAFAALQPTNAFYIQDRLGIDTVPAIRQAGFVSTGFAACSFAIQGFAVPRLALPPGRLLPIGLAICLGGVVACLLASSYGWLLWGFGLLGIGFGFAQPGLMAGASLAAGDRQAEAAGMLQAAMSAAWIAGALAGTGLYGLSIAGPLVLAALAIVAALLVALVVGRERETGLL